MSSGFITESEIEEKKKLRQEEWERVRKPEEPLEVPEEPASDHRSLYERLQDQKTKKQEEYEEAHKLKNLVKVLDDDEVDFLNYVDTAKIEDERRKRLEEARELSEFRNAVSKLREKEMEERVKVEVAFTEPLKSPPIKPDVPSIGSRKTPLNKLMSGLIKRKTSPTDQNIEPTQKPDEPLTKNRKVIEGEPSGEIEKIESVPYKGNLVCIGVLPGLSSYTNSSDEAESEDDKRGDADSSDSEEMTSPTVRDLCGRRIVEAATQKKN